MKKVLLCILSLVMFVIGCTNNQGSDNSGCNEISYLNNEMEEHETGYLSNSEEIETESEMPDEETVAEQHQELSADDCWEEHLERWRVEYLEQRDKNIVDYITRGSYTPADRDIELHRI